jgi:hypothetical protein
MLAAFVVRWLRSVGAHIEGVGNVLVYGIVVSKAVVGYYGEVFDKNI